MASLQLLGAGGHARLLYEVRYALGDRFTGYIDPEPCAWLTGLRHIRQDSDASPADGALVIGIAGVTPAMLARRLSLVNHYRDRGFAIQTVRHASAILSPSAEIDDGAQILAGSIVQPAARLAFASILNTGAILEHDATVGQGSHIGPGARVLGGAVIGETCMIGAGAVILPGIQVPSGTTVPANTVYRHAPIPETSQD